MPGMNVLAACFLIAAQTYSIPPAVLLGVYQVEGGKIGQAVGPNDNGTYDLGPMQINTSWLPLLSSEWNVSKATAKSWILDDPCTNVGVAAWILRRNLNETGDLALSIANYHSRTPHIGTPYKRKVVGSMQRNGLLKSAE
jgi:soluble lytic murein transglycosylase-like protein